jgi:hypothetical protein
VRIECNMGEGQVSRKDKGGLLLFVLPTASNDIHCFGRVPMSVGIAGRKEGYVD